MNCIIERVWLRDPVLERVTKFNPRCTEARSGSASSHPAALWMTLTEDFAWSGQLREPTLTTDGKLCHQETLSQPPTWTQHQLNSRAQEELEEKSISLRNVWRGTRLTLSRSIQIMTLFREGCTSNREISFMAHGTSDHCPGCRALVSGGRCRIRVEGEIRKTEEVRACLHATASRVGEAPTKPALKRVRFAENRVDDSAEIPEPMSVSAPSTLPAQAASSSSVPTPSAERASSTSTIEVPDQVMSEGASSSSGTGVKRSNTDSSNLESETKRFHADHSTRDVVMLLYDSDVGQAVEQCRGVCRRKGTFLVDANGWD